MTKSHTHDNINNTNAPDTETKDRLGRLIAYTADIVGFYGERTKVRKAKIQDCIDYCDELSDSCMFKLIRLFRRLRPSSGRDPLVNLREMLNAADKECDGLPDLPPDFMEVFSGKTKKGLFQYYTHYDVIKLGGCSSETESLYEVRKENERRVFYVSGGDPARIQSSFWDALVDDNCIRDAIIIADNVIWQETSEYLQKEFGFKFATSEALALELVPKISIVVLTYNNFNLNKICINSILTKTAYPAYELIIVDNGSTDSTIEWLKKLDSRQLPQVKIIFNRENLGFSAGNNIGIHMADGQYIVLLNNDTCVTRGWLTGLVKHMENDKSLGMVGPVTNAIGNEAKINVNYFGLTGLDIFADRYIAEHRNILWQDPRVLAMFCTMIRRDVIEKYGGLHEGYGRGLFEDDDYAMAVRKAGYRLAIAESSFVHHFENRSIRQIEDEERTSLFLTNKTLFEKRWNTAWIPHVFRPGVYNDTNVNNLIPCGDDIPEISIT